MAFQTGSTTSIENLMQTLSTFLVANGWTEDYANTGDPGTIAFSKNSVFVSFQYSETADGLGHLAIYQATANDTADTADPWLSTGDSGSGEPSNTIANFDNGRCVNDLAGPHVAYWFFENDSAPAYCHVVVEIETGIFRHFGFGELDKIGDYVGGEYCYGHFWDLGIRIDQPNFNSHNFGLESYGSNALRGGTIRVDGYVNEPDPATIWACFATQNANDRAGNPRWQVTGGWRGAKEYTLFQNFRISEATGFKPMCQIAVELRDTSVSPQRFYRIGYQSDVRACNIGNLAPGQIINIGGDDWYFFPLVRKQNLNSGSQESENTGMAYRRVNA